MEELDIKELLKYFYSKKISIIFAVILAFIIGFINSQCFKTPLYKSYTTVALTRSTTTTEDSAITSGDVSLNKSLVSTYREIIKSRRVLNQVVENLDLDISASTLGSTVEVTNEQDTELIRISISNSDNILARDIANEISEVFCKEIKDIYDIENISIIDRAIESDTPYNMNLQKDLVISIGIGLLIGLMIIFIIYYFDTTIKSADIVEEKLKLPILGVVPLDDSIVDRNEKSIKDIISKRGKKHGKKHV